MLVQQSTVVCLFHISNYFWVQIHLKIFWSVGKGSNIFRENSLLFDFHLKAYYVCIVIHLKCS